MTMKSLHYPLDATSKIEALKAELQQIELTIQQNLNPTGSPVAQAKRLIAEALKNEARTILTRVEAADKVLKPNGPPPAASSDSPVSAPQQSDGSNKLVETMAVLNSVTPEAISLFLVESGSVMTKIVEMMITHAKIKLLDADAADGAIAS
jgi:hypothetical protein